MTKGAVRRYNRRLEELAFQNSLFASEIISLKEQLRQHERCGILLKLREDEIEQLRKQRDDLNKQVTNIGRQVRSNRKEKSEESPGPE